MLKEKDIERIAVSNIAEEVQARMPGATEWQVKNMFEKITGQYRADEKRFLDFMKRRLPEVEIIGYRDAEKIKEA